MPNVLPTAPPTPVAPKTRPKVSALGVILTIILAVVVILLFERVMFDFNRTANPVIEQTISKSSPSYYGSTSYLASEKSSLSSTRIYYPREKTEEYRLYRMLLHAAFVLPIFLLMFLVYYYINLKKRDENLYVVTWAYMAGAIWILLHLIGQAGQYVVDAYKNAAIYIILIFLAVILTSLAVLVQKKRVAND
jgi:CDP-diglyceride synthetase